VFQTDVTDPNTDVTDTNTDITDPNKDVTDTNIEVTDTNTENLELITVWQTLAFQPREKETLVLSEIFRAF